MELATKQWTQSEKQSDLCLGRFGNGVDSGGVKYDHTHTGLKKAREVRASSQCIASASIFAPAHAICMVQCFGRLDYLCSAPKV